MQLTLFAACQLHQHLADSSKWTEQAYALYQVIQYSRKQYNADWFSLSLLEQTVTGNYVNKTSILKCKRRAYQFHAIADKLLSSLMSVVLTGSKRNLMYCLKRSYSPNQFLDFHIQDTRQICRWSCQEFLAVYQHHESHSQYNDHFSCQTGYLHQVHSQRTLLGLRKEEIMAITRPF